jgi:hypothetical protein
MAYNPLHMGTNLFARDSEHAQILLLRSELFQDITQCRIQSLNLNSQTAADLCHKPQGHLLERKKGRQKKIPPALEE